MDNRIDREKEYHNMAFTDNTRYVLDKYYAITGSIEKYYDSLVQDCRGKKVLEYGCGQSSRAFKMNEYGATVTGIDISDVAIAKANEIIKVDKLANIEFKVMNAEVLEFADETFNLICGTAILHHLDLNKAYQEIKRVLKKDGQAVFMEPLGHNPFINLYRWLTPKYRTPDEHPLLMKDIRTAKKTFTSVQVNYYYLFAIISVFFYKFKIFNKVLIMLEGFDKLIFKIFPFFKRYAWYTVIVLKDN